MYNSCVSLPSGPIHWKTAILVGAVSLFSFFYFYEGGGWNQNSRFDLLRAIVERHTLEIDAYHENTQDKAHYRGHYYSEKAPGLVFLALPFAEAARTAMRITGFDPQSARGLYGLSYVVTAGAVALPTALCAVCLFFLGCRISRDPAGATFAAVIFAIATPTWAYASLFWAHALVGACLLFAYAGAIKLRDQQTASRDFLLGLAVGLTAGWATVTEYPAAPATVLLALLAVFQVWPRGSRARWRTFAGISIGAGICMIALFGYLYAAFGALRPSYSYYDPNSFSFMQQQGYMGLTYPHPDRLLKLLFGCSRGIFFASPVLVAGPIGLWKLRKDQTWRLPAIVAAIIAAYYFLFNASFYWWKSGLSFGPRYAGAAIPFLCLGLPVAWSRAGKTGRRVLLALALCSVFLALMVISTTSQLSMQDSCPILHSSWPLFRTGQLAVNHDSMLSAAEGSAYGAFNLGQLLGLRGLWSLVPLLLFWIAAALFWFRLDAGSFEKVPNPGSS